MTDPRIRSGTRAMLARRQALLDTGEHHLGWKLGFGAPAAQARFELDRPLVGFLTRERRIASGATASLEGWVAPTFEAELAVHLGAPVRPGDSREQVASAVAGLALAIELADVAPPPTDVEVILEGNIFHRHVLVGAVAEAPPSIDRIAARVQRDGVEIAATEDVEALTGPVLENLALTSETLSEAGAGLEAGDMLIAGSFVTPFGCRPGETYTVQAAGLNAVSVTLS